VEPYRHSPNKPSWCGAYLKHRDNFTFTLWICCKKKLDCRPKRMKLKKKKKKKKTTTAKLLKKRQKAKKTFEIKM
jgi:hypothetical protein